MANIAPGLDPADRVRRGHTPFLPHISAQLPRPSSEREVITVIPRVWTGEGACLRRKAVHPWPGDAPGWHGEAAWIAPPLAVRVTKLPEGRASGLGRRKGGALPMGVVRTEFMRNRWR